MEFTQLRLEKLADTKVGKIYKGVTNNFYDLDDKPLPEKEMEFSTLLQKIIQGKASISSISKLKDVSVEFVEDFREKVIAVIEMNSLLEKIPSKSIFFQLLEALIISLKSVKFISDKGHFAETVLHNSIGLKQLSFFSLEDDFEELLVNDLDSVFVFHKKFGYCKVNIVLEERILNSLVQRISISVGKKFNDENPLLDARLPDGSRVNATMPIISPRAISLTIRKFPSSPLTVLDLIDSKAITTDAAAFLWVMVDGFGFNPQNILIVGGTASGKTTMLNVLSNFIRINERIVSIEDTLEISLLNRDNWVALEARHSSDGDIGIDQLLKNSLRMRPDRILVGEVRGEEAITLFTAMDNGHSGFLGTLHSRSAREAISKLEERPFEIPTSMINLLDLIIVLNKKYSREAGVKRYVSEIAEVARMDKTVLLANVFETKNAETVLERTDLPSHVIEEFAQRSSMTKTEVYKEINTRKMIIEWMMEKKIRKAKEILEVIQSYYFDKEKVLSMLKEN